jgi:signal transduction histidine kinase
MPFKRGAMAARPARTRPVRLTLVGLLVVPLVTLVALWGVAVGSTLGSAVTEHKYNAVTNTIGGPTQALSAQLSQEQAQSFIWLSTGRRSPVAPLDATRQRTDIVVATARGALESIQGEVPSVAKQPLAALFTKLGQLRSVRAAIDAGTTSPPAAFQSYSNIIDAEFEFFEHAVRVQNASLFQQSIGTIDASRSLVQAGREAALVGGALAARGQMSTADRELFANTVTSQRLLTGEALVLLDPAIRSKYVQVFTSPTYHQFAAMENTIAGSIGDSGPIPVDPQTWETVSGSFLASMEKVETENSDYLATLANHLSSRLVTNAVLAGGLGLVALIASVFLMLWFGRRLTGELTGLHRSAQSMAEDRLPSVVERLRSGEEVDVSAESPPPSTGKIAEIAKVAEAFATVQRTAIEAAVGQANLRKGVNQVFLNLSLRNQSLLHRQLGLLDTMERATDEPSALADLFRLDHLTTRMRRHAEGLIILSGATPGRGWRDPVLAVDVLRAAIAEVEDYVRVDVISDSRDSIVGVAVNDMIHLIAELVENATAFSPPNTQVEIKADSVGNGFAVEIEDRGLGLTSEEMAEINERLAKPPQFDLANSDQLGLFVVGQLAARHGIKVSLYDSPYGGTRAIVLMPLSIIVRAGETGEQDALGNGGRPAAFEPATSPLPSLAAEAGGSRERSSVFSLTGRHRLAPGSFDEQTVPERAGTTVQATAVTQRRAAIALPPAASPPAAVALPGVVPAPVAPAPAAPAQESPWPEESWSQDSWPGPPWQEASATQSPESPWREPPWQEVLPPEALPEEGLPPVPLPREASWQEGWEQVPRQRIARPQPSQSQVSPAQISPPPAARQDTATAGEGLTGSGPAEAGTHLGMPRRIRQASLAPQLRNSPPSGTHATSAGLNSPSARSPEQARSLMSALQAGWQHGRTDDLDHPAGDEPGDSWGTETDPSDGEAT